MDILAVVVESIKSEIKVNDEGKASFTICGAARLVNVSQQTLSNHFVAHSKTRSKLAQKLVSQGFDCNSFSEKGIPDLAFALIASIILLMRARDVLSLQD